MASFLQRPSSPKHHERPLHLYPEVQIDLFKAPDAPFHGQRKDWPVHDLPKQQLAVQAAPPRQKVPFEGQRKDWPVHDVQPRHKGDAVQYTPSSAPFYGSTTSNDAHKKFDMPRRQQVVQAAPPRQKVPFEGQRKDWPVHDVQPRARARQTVQHSPSQAPFYGNTTSGDAHKKFDMPRRQQVVQAAPPRQKVRFEGTTTAQDNFKGWNLSDRRLSIGLETLGGLFYRLIPATMSIPCRPSQVFSTVSDDQTVVNIKIFEGEREIAVENKLLGEFDLVDIPNASRGVPQIEVIFDVNQDNILHVEARDKVTGRFQTIELSDPYALDKPELQELIRDATAHKQDDIEEKALIEANKRADVQLYMARKAANRMRAQGKTSEETDLRFAMKEVENAMRGDDIPRINALANALKPFTRGLKYESIY